MFYVVEPGTQPIADRTHVFATRDTAQSYVIRREQRIGRVIGLAEQRRYSEQTHVFDNWGSYQLFRFLETGWFILLVGLLLFLAAWVAW